ncbi:hypothetical protein KM043_015351 [Ampulex compressa]|nr:hypothetical protein KM043_015351 [Ampulex compressa]
MEKTPVLQRSHSVGIYEGKDGRGDIEGKALRGQTKGEGDTKEARRHGEMTPKKRKPGEQRNEREGNVRAVRCLTIATLRQFQLECYYTTGREPVRWGVWEQSDLIGIVFIRVAAGNKVVSMMLSQWNVNIALHRPCFTDKKTGS